MTTYQVNWGTGAVVAVTSTSGNTALPSSFAQSRRVKISNAGPNPAFVRFGPASQTAVTTDFCVLNGESVTVELSPSYTNMGAICAATQTATLYLSPVSTLE